MTGATGAASEVLRATMERDDYLAWVRGITAQEHHGTADPAGIPSERDD